MKIAKFNEIGRSMVEMLGVLAIIGVLSVGAIAGYSKAMFKYKLNKHTESFNMLMANAVQIEPKLHESLKQDGYSYRATLFRDLGLIPDGIKYHSDLKMTDIFGNTIEIQYSELAYYITLTLERSGTKLTSQALEICRNTILTLKEYADDIKRDVRVRTYLPEGSATNYAEQMFKGNKTCTNSDICLKDIGVNEINEACLACESERDCMVVIYLRSGV